MKFFDLILMGMFSACVSFAEEAPAPTTALQVRDLVAEVLKENREIQFYEAELAAAKAGRKAAGLLGNPEVSGTIGRKSLSDGAAREGTAWSVSVLQPFEWPGRLGLRKAIANRDIELAQIGLERFRLALAGRVRTLAFELAAAQEKGSVAQEVAERFKALREVLVQRDPAGLTPLLETRVIEATELAMQRRASRAVLATRIALMELNQLRGARPDAPLSISGAEVAFRPANDLETLLSAARTNNFELRLRMVELAQQGFRVELAKNERFPSIAMGPTIAEERAGDRERIVGFALSVPVPLWNRNTANIETAQARLVQAKVSLEVLGRELERQITQAALSFETKRNEMAKWRPDAVQHFQEAAGLADRHYRLGAVPIATYVELQNQYLEAVEALLETKNEALDAALQLQMLTGLPAFFEDVSARKDHE